MKKIENYILKCISLFFITTTLISIPKMIDICHHAYVSQNTTISYSREMMNNVCNNPKIVSSYHDISELCFHHAKIAQRSILWETIVEITDQFSLCAKKKNYHDEHNLNDKHVHVDHALQEHDCSYVYVFFIGVVFAFMIMIYFLILKNRNNNNNSNLKNKLKIK